MKYNKGIQLKKINSESNPYEVYVPKALFGQMIRKRFATQAQAKDQIRIFENQLREKERVPLDPEIHNVISNYQTIFNLSLIHI